MKQVSIKDPKELQTVLDKALNDDNVPKVYANGYVTATGHGDITLLFQRNGKPVSVLNLSFSVAKTLALSLGETIKDLENKTENNIMTVFDIQKALAKEIEGNGEIDE
jgi:hypothetical protein